ncbi:MAG: lytic murein transglycosylase [Pseudolabrys sp.]|nr:lytic murein transglycosylase [Pseudolabrys sp.]
MLMPITKLLVAAVFLLNATSAARADAAFSTFLESMWPRAQQFGVSRAVFDASIRGLEPDLTLPDLELPGRPERPPPGQAEFVQTPSQYLRESSFDRLAARGRQLAAQYRDTLARIDKEFGVPGNIVLAIWARETDYGSYKLPHDALRVLATQGFTGKRKELFQTEFLYALKMIQDGTPRADMRSSWGGALGLTQFLPSEFYKLGVDFDRDGRADIFRSVPDALASAAKQLQSKGWQSGERWAYEVRAPANADCSIGTPDITMPVGDWVKRGFLLAPPRKLTAQALSQPASLLQPEGSYGPAFLTTKNYYVIKEYNFSDLYVLFVGHLADRIAGAKSFETPWSKTDQLKTRDVEAMQQRLTELGLYADKIDGKAGMLTRAALGKYQKANGLKVDCWPTAAVLTHMRR